jgi:peptide/nickel transport system permease protein
VLSFIVRRILLAGLVVFLVTSAVFFMLYLQGDPVLALLEGHAATPEQVQAIRHALGYDRPIPVQFVSYWAHVVRGDFGTSLQYDIPVMTVIMDRLPYTAILALASFVLAMAVAIPAGVFGGLAPGSVFDRVSVVVVALGQAVPIFVVGPLLIVVFAVALRVLPVAGVGSPEHIVLPAITLAVYPTARITRMLRLSIREVADADFVRAARGKGLAESTLALRHVLRNAALPVLTLAGLQLGALLGGAFITETIFGWPGIGSLAVQALQAKDFPLVQGLVIVAAVAITSLNLLTDIAYALVDPRVRY